MNTNDTIAAPATGLGGAVTIIRISGKHAVEYAGKVWQGRLSLAETEPRKMYLGKAGDDQALAVYMKAPASYTGDDVVELQCHGGAIVANSVLRALLNAGCRMAEPGEFSKRAFLNGKLDLAQAEAVADLISSETEAAHRIALQQMKGGFSSELKVMRDDLLNLVSLMELELDFSEEDVEFADRTQLTQLLGAVSARVTQRI